MTEALPLTRLAEPEATFSVRPAIALHGVLLEGHAGGVRLKARGFPEVHLSYEAAAAVGRELTRLASAALHARA